MARRPALEQEGRAAAGFEQPGLCGAGRKTQPERGIGSGEPGAVGNHRRQRLQRPNRLVVRLGAERQG